MALNLTVLGRDGSYPGRGGACSGYLVRGGGATVWLDAGPGTLANLQQHVDPFDVDAIVLTHEHPDHWSDVHGFIVACRHGPQVRKGVPVYAPAGLADHMYFEPRPTLDIEVVADGDTVTTGELSWRFSRTDHPVETLATRVEGDGRSLGYSADSGPGWELSELGSGLDLALCEATLTREQEGTVQHLSARQAGETARRAGARRLVLTHLWPTLDVGVSAEAASQAFGGPVEVATPGARFDV